MDLSKILARPIQTKTAHILKQAATPRKAKLDDDAVLTKLSSLRKQGIQKQK